jgi:protein-L-isoaspartate(D-aspartate) O-methyltransferase
MRPVPFILLIFFLLSFTAYQDQAKSREQMVRLQIENRGVKDKATLNAMRKVPRHLFVPASEVTNAYEDRPIPIGYGQTISQPYIVGYMTEAIKPTADFRVLEIGTGSGYQAAILSQIVKEVYTIEIIEALSAQSTGLLRKLNYKNIETKNADGYFAIIVTAAAEHVPPSLVEQLKDGGRMIIPVGSPFMTQQLMLIEKTGGKIRSTSLMPVRFVPFKRSA